MQEVRGVVCTSERRSNTLIKNTVDRNDAIKQIRSEANSTVNKLA